jgi:hypothetical protein
VPGAVDQGIVRLTCDSRGTPMVPNVSTLDDDACGWTCIDPGCPEPGAQSTGAAKNVNGAAATKSPAALPE